METKKMKHIWILSVKRFNLVYQNNIRKGNAVILSRDQKGKIERAHFVKRGLKKTKAITFDQLDRLNLEEELTSSSTTSIGLSSRCIQEMDSHLKSGPQCSVDLVKETKSNGLKVLISYDEVTCCWIIGTERDTIAVYKSSDINEYHDSGLYELKQAAYCFLELIGGLSESELADLQDDLRGFTLVGEYVGDYTIQKIVPYSKPELVFYAMVLNNKTLQCYPPENALDFFEKYGLPHCEYKICRNLTTIGSVMEALGDLANHIEQSTLQKSEEGAVIFLVLQRELQQKVLVISKIKTLEYRLYKQLKVRVMEHIDLHRDARDQYDLFSEEIYSIIKDADLHHSTNYYLNIADAAFRFCYEYPDFHRFVKSHFVSFLSLIINSLHESYRLSPVIIKDKKKLRTIENKNWYSYSMGTLNLRNLDTKRIFRTKKSQKEPDLYIKKSLHSSNEAKSLSSSAKKEEIKKESPELYKKKSNQKPIPETLIKETEREDLSDTNTAVLIPVSLSGFGISHFIDHLCKTLESMPINIRYRVVDTGRIREQLLKEVEGEKNRLGIEEYLNVVNDTFKDRLENEVIAQMKDMKVHKTGLNLVIIKRHANCQQAQEMIATIKKRITGEIKFFCLTSSTVRYEGNISLVAKNKKVNLPFNHYMLLTCLKRKFSSSIPKDTSQKDHELLCIEQVLSQASKFADCKLDSESMKQIGFDGFIGFPFTNVQNEESLSKKEYYSRAVSALDKVLLAFLSKVEPEETHIKDLKSEIENFKVGIEWWQVDSAESGGSEYHHFVLKSISSLLKKYKSICNTLLGNGRSSQLSIQRDKDGNPIIELNFDPKDIEKNIEIEQSIEKQLNPIKNLNSVGKRKKPRELGIHSKLNNEMMQKVFRNLAIDILTNLEKYESHVAEDKADILANRNLQFEEAFRISILYIGNKTLSKEEDAIYNAFESDHEFPFLVHGMVYVPGTAVIGITKINRSLVMMEEEFDHLMIMSTRPGDRSLGRSILEQVFGHEELLDHWRSKLNKMRQVGICKIEINGETKLAYLIPFKKKVLVDAITKSQ